MKVKLLKKKEKEKNQETKQIVTIPVQEEKVKSIEKQKNFLQNLGFQKYTALTKLRIAVGTIFILCTISMIFIFFGGWLISALLLLMGYILLFILLIELLRVKKL
jgi:hypothetical protein